ncbi:hypothetical protein AYI69_g8603 [Smittium culicis]|uniref:Uncharacterized protein n=1 Tax=Smittium culicis TaxID=133412 RepID=A0A1R1XIH4_9FUNG|nr:hypothetical protein AYI69_g8603 [Smittium culicis]
MICAVTAAINKDNSIVIDPTQEIIDKSDSCHTFAFGISESDSPVYVNSVGTFSKDQVRNKNTILLSRT